MKRYSNPQTEVQVIMISAICGQSVYSNVGLKGGGEGEWQKAL